MQDAENTAAVVEGQTEQPEVSQDKTEGQTEQSGEVSQTSEADKAEAEAKAKKARLADRFSELTRQRKEAERQAEFYKAQLDAAQQKATKDDAKPDPGKYENVAEYLEDLTDWKTRQATRELSVKQAEQAKKSAESASMNAKVQTYAERAKQAAVDIADFAEVMESADDIQVSDALRDAILESDLGPEVAYHLAKNPDVARKLSGMSASSAAREIGKIEARIEFDRSAKSKVSSAPKPGQSVKAGGSNIKDPSRMNDAEWFKYRQQQARKR